MSTSSFFILQQQAVIAAQQQQQQQDQNTTTISLASDSVNGQPLNPSTITVIAGGNGSRNSTIDHCNQLGGFHDGMIVASDGIAMDNDEEYTDDSSEYETLDGAAYQSRMSPDKMMEDEIKAFPDVIEHPGLIPIYLHIRNSILMYWYQNPKTQLLLEEIHHRLEAPFNGDHAFVGRIFYFLERFGYINFGIFNIEKESINVKKPKIIIIGAGMAGLTAARQLLYFGFEVMVLESRNRIGGRVCTYKQGKYIADVGATVITGLGGNPIRVLERQISMKLKRLSQKCPLYFNNKPIDFNKDVALEGVFNLILEGTNFLSNQMGFNRIGDKQLSLGDALEIVLELQDREIKQHYMKYLEDISMLEEKRKITLDQMKTLQDCMDAMYEKHKEYVQLKSQRSIKQDYQYRVNRYQLNQSVTKYNLLKENVKCLEDKIRHLESQEPPNHYLSPGDRRILDWHFANLEFATATPLRTLSHQYWDQDEAFEFTGPQICVKNGYSCIPYALANGIEVKLNSVVRSIQMTPHGVEVTAVNIDKYNHMYDGKELNKKLDTAPVAVFNADAVICTCPLGVLKNSVDLNPNEDSSPNAIKFIPPIPESKAAAIRRLGFGNLNKVVLIFDSIFWDTNNNLFGHVAATGEATRGELFLYWAIYKQPVLMALIAGESAEKMEKVEDEIIKKKCLDILGSIFPEMSPLKSYYVTRWRSDPWALGAFSYISTEASGDDFDLIADHISHPSIVPANNNNNTTKEPPMVPRIFFAGEHTIRHHPATVHGALLSGVREAAKIANQFLGVPYQLKKI